MFKSDPNVEKMKPGRSGFLSVFISVDPWLYSLLLRLAPVLLATTLHAATNLLPGLTYYQAKEPLTGSLVFLLQHEAAGKTYSDKAASIYKFDLVQGKLRKVTDAPGGLFLASGQGDSYCVIHGRGDWGGGQATNVFVHSESLRSSRTLDLEVPPRQTVVIPGHIFFQFEGSGELSTPDLYAAKDKRTSLESKIVDYDISKDKQHPIELPGSSTWQYQQYDRIHSPRKETNTLHFYYKAFGKRLDDGTDHRAGFYDLNVSNGKIQWFADLIDDQDNEGYSPWKACDGRFIFFEGDSAPITGYRLVSSPWNVLQTRTRDPKGDRVKELKVFPRVFVLGAYLFSDIAPDGCHALVRLEQPTSSEFGALPGKVIKYYLVDALNGNTRILLEDEVDRKRAGHMSVVRWVR
jgi:hypothetical protein